MTGITAENPNRACPESTGQALFSVCRQLLSAPREQVGNILTWPKDVYRIKIIRTLKTSSPAHPISRLIFFQFFPSRSPVMFAINRRKKPNKITQGGRINTSNRLPRRVTTPAASKWAGIRSGRKGSAISAMARGRYMRTVNSFSYQALALHVASRSCQLLLVCFFTAYPSFSPS